MEEALDAWTGTLEKVFPTRVTENNEEVGQPDFIIADRHPCMQT